MKVLEHRYYSYFIDRIIFTVTYLMFVFYVDEDILAQYIEPEYREKIRVYGFLFYFLFYFLAQELFFHTTIGKALLGLKVVNKNGEKVNTKSIIIRNLCRLIPFDSISFFGAKTGFHDKIAKTNVIKIYALKDLNLKINDTVSVVLISRKNRFWSYLIDRVIIIFWYMIFRLFVDELILKDSSLNVINKVYLFGFISIYFIYFFGLEMISQTSFAKKIFKATVVNQKGQKPTLKELLIRNLMRLIPLDTLSFAYDRRGLHDKISKTYVVTKVEVSK